MRAHHLPLQLIPYGKGEACRAIGGQIQQKFRLRRLRFRLRQHNAPWTRHLLHKIAHLFPGAYVALGKQLLIGILHGDLAHLQMLRQRPLGGQLLSRCQLSGQNGGTEAAVEGFVEGKTRCFF